MFLGVPYTIGFQSSSSDVGESMVHIYEYMMMFSVAVLSVLASLLYTGMIWFQHYEYKDTAEMWFSLGKFSMGQVNWKLMHLMNMVKYNEMNQKGQVFTLSFFVFLKAMSTKFQMLNLVVKTLTFNLNFVIALFTDNEKIILSMTNFYLVMLSKLFEFTWASAWFFSLFYMSLMRIISECMYVFNSQLWELNWNFFSHTFRYKKYIYPLLYIISMWFTEWQLWFKLSDVMKKSESSEFKFSGMEAEEDLNLLSSKVKFFMDSSSVVDSEIQSDVIFSKVNSSGSVLELDSYLESNLNCYWYCQSKTGDVSFETFWGSLPGYPLLMVWMPTVYLVYSQNESVEAMYSVKVVGKQWFWFYEMIFMKAKDNAKLPVVLHNFEFKGTPTYAVLSLLEVWRILDNLNVKRMKFKSKMMLTKYLHVGQLSLLEVDKWLVMRVNQEIQVMVSGLDVIHSFGIQGLGCKMDAVPGSVHGIVVFLSRYGKFYGQCSELCGMNHGYMPIVVEVGKALSTSNLLFGLQRC